MKKFLLVSIVVMIVALSACNVYDTKEYKNKYFSNSEDFVTIKNILVNHYEDNELQGNLRIWRDEDGAKIYADGFDGLVNNSSFDIPFSDDDISKINTFLMKSSYYECVSIDKDFVEFGNTTGSKFMYYCRTDKKPEKISDAHEILNFDDGWYFSISITR
ncbi:MAG: hypothetical protein IJZ94_00035 [Clostridia bacterium]|nr:hypothetical protein [Clostridia bacterium]